MLSGALAVTTFLAIDPFLASCGILDRRLSAGSLELAWHVAGVNTPQRLAGHAGSAARLSRESHPLPRRPGGSPRFLPAGRTPAVQRFFQRRNEAAFSRVTSAVPTSMRFSTGCPRAALMASSMLRLPMVSGY